MKFIKENWKGILLCIGLAVPASLLGGQFPVIGGPVFAILAGMILAPLVKRYEPFGAGIKFTSKKNFAVCGCALGIRDESGSRDADRKVSLFLL